MIRLNRVRTNEGHPQQLSRTGKRGYLKRNCCTISVASNRVKLGNTPSKAIVGSQRKNNSSSRQGTNVRTAKHLFRLLPLGMLIIIAPKAATGGSPIAMTIISRPVNFAIRGLRRMLSQPKIGRCDSPTIRRNTTDDYIAAKAGTIAPDPLDKNRVNAFIRLHQQERPTAAQPLFR